MENDTDCYSSLDSLLYKVTFNSTDENQNYTVEHGDFYSMLSRNKGVKHLATLIHKVCMFIKKMNELGLIYGNLRPENILIKFDKFKSRIE